MYDVFKITNRYYLLKLYVCMVISVKYLSFSYFKNQRGRGGSQFNYFYFSILKTLIYNMKLSIGILLTRRSTISVTYSMSARLDFLCLFISCHYNNIPNRL